MLVLGIETTCDETAIGIVRDGQDILCNVIHSQIPIHRAFGGVYPEIASRHHVDVFEGVLQEALNSSGVSLQEIDLISVAKGPGLVGSLLIGVNAAKALSLALEKPLIGVNHVEAHLYAAMMQQEQIFPAMGLIISGGHTLLVEVLDVGQYRQIGTTVDDAIGEAFDKVAKLLDLPYPGGPEIEQLALQGDPKSFAFKAGQRKDHPYDFSFSGLKTNVFYAIHGQNSAKHLTCPLNPQTKANVAASFQEVALSDVVQKTIKAAQERSSKAIYVGGGVSNSSRIKTLFRDRTDIPLFFPKKGLSLDNGAMIAGLGFHVYRTQGYGDSLTWEPRTRIPLVR